MTPADVKACSVWEFEAAVAGYVAANTSDDGQMTTEQEDDLWQGVMERMH